MSDIDDLMIELQERLRDVAHNLKPELVGLGDPARELGSMRHNLDQLTTSVMQLASIVQGLRNPK